MKDRNFEAKIYHSSFCIHRIKAKTADEAIRKARRLPINEGELLYNLENWEEADEATPIE